MPPRSKITREMIIDAAYEIVRELGEGSLNARSIADRLGCSTQPVLYVFRTMDEIRECVYQKADEYHSEYL
ncbi:MAG: TetR/AcrR family transcriptional regulator, partial [Bullifex sp.]|nr:TetR/AcrR family transcriptional regulator [Bullifex sp.]